MQLLLDTHIWIWSVSEPDRLSAKVRKALEGSDSDLWLSPISVWEAMILFQRGQSSPMTTLQWRSRKCCARFPSEWRP
jgi:PIN domain nuclease of toxin-antitoxin system